MKVKGITKGWVKPRVNLAAKKLTKSSGCSSCGKKKNY